MVLENLCQNCRELLDSKVKLKKLEKKILNFIHNYQINQNLSPSYLEILKNCDIKSSSNLQRYLKDLKEKLFIDFTPGSARDIRILRKEGWLDD
tara:strand:+ start:5311 stop:5592 length:282 start_codon:yes stop_codon:yes gene_type:complete